MRRPEDFPELMTIEEAAEFLRLDGPDGPQDLYQVFYRYRRQRLLRAVQVGRRLLFPKAELISFIQRKTEGCQ